MDARKVRLHPYAEDVIRQFSPAVAPLLPRSGIVRVAYEFCDRFTLALAGDSLLSFPCPARFRGLFYRELHEEFDADRVEELKVGYEQWLNSIT